MSSLGVISLCAGFIDNKVLFIILMKVASQLLQ
ncbi:hypothetical protein AZE42_14097 [Rhizopogon vesiculosus]|uniref:Uncharacterized protein n=1 Tax=Rhizopogon vesiculosus TaxID=180088 RepID=A0A1J8R0F3_9AGAM|nr:hypothetical protein AZE42_14097 [Rhizopogon vesiculosus]